MDNIYTKFPEAYIWIYYWLYKNKKYFLCEVKHLKKHLKKDSVVLNAMGGTSLINKYFHNKIIDYDSSKEMLKMSNAKMNVLGKAGKMPFRENSFDLVACLGNSFPILSPHELISFLNESSIVLKPGGIIYMTYFNPPILSYNLKILIKSNVRRLLAMPFRGYFLTKIQKEHSKGETYYPMGYIKSLLKNSGFHKIKFKRGIKDFFIVIAEKNLNFK